MTVRMLGGRSAGNAVQSGSVFITATFVSYLALYPALFALVMRRLLATFGLRAFVRRALGFALGGSLVLCGFQRCMFCLLALSRCIEQRFFVGWRWAWQHNPWRHQHNRQRYFACWECLECCAKR